jgi:PPOX class probable F420-dependent enzyme
VEELEAELRRRVERVPVARLATVRPDGRPHVVPITFALEGHSVVTAVDHKPKTTTSLQRLRNIEANPVASVLVDNYEDDWSRLWWARGDGAARIVAEGAEREEAVERLVEKYRQYRETPPRGPVIVVSVSRWVTWSP